MSEKKYNLLENPVNITITTIAPPKGSGRNRAIEDFDFKSHFGTNKAAVIPVENSADNYCLFYALEMSRIYHDQTEISQFNKEQKKQKTKAKPPQHLTTHYKFTKILKNSDLQRDLAIRLMRNAEIPLNRSSYGIGDLQNVQDFYDREYGSMYRIVVMDDSPSCKPLWKGPYGRKYVVAVSMELQTEHFFGLKSISQYFFAKKYCPGIAFTFLFKIN